jgi:hypothetical protein
MMRTAADYEAEATECLARAEASNRGTSQAMYWLSRAHVFAVLAVAATPTRAPATATAIPVPTP